MQTTTATLLNTALAMVTPDNELLAGRCCARILITADTSADAEASARRVHGLSVRQGFPFLRVEAADFPIERRMLRDTCSDLLDDTAGGTIFINDVEAMPSVVQDVLIELLAELEDARDVFAAVRVMSGTTVSLLDRVATNTFAERLFYRLNIIHLLPPGDRPIDPA